MGERQQTVGPEDMATTSTAVTTVSPQPLQEESVERMAVITLRPAERTEARKKVVWTEDTVDNEDMNKKKSKCCCVFVKPRKFDESDSSSSDSECEHCFGHVEKKKVHRTHQQQQGPLTITDSEVTDAPAGAAVPTATITLQPPEPASADPAPSPPDRTLPTS